MSRETKEHKHAALLRMAADDESQRFECDEYTWETILGVISEPYHNWRPVPKPKKTVKRWLWSRSDGYMTKDLYSEEEIEQSPDTFTRKLLWSETIFEVEG